MKRKFVCNGKHLSIFVGSEIRALEAEVKNTG